MKHLDAVMMVFVVMVLVAGFDTLSKVPSPAQVKTVILSLQGQDVKAPSIAPIQLRDGLKLAQSNK